MANETWSGLVRVSYAPKKYRVRVFENVKRVLRHHSAFLKVSVTTPVKPPFLELQRKLSPNRFQNALCFFRDFWPDSITRYDRNL